jgi:hypothetical protein
MIASLFLAGPSEPSKHIPHALIPLLRFGHGVPVMACLLAVVLLLCYAVFKLSQMRSA